MKRISVLAKLWLAFIALVVVVMIPLELSLNKLLGDFYSRQVTEPLLYHSEQLAIMLAEDIHAIQVASYMGQMVGGEVLVLNRTGSPVKFPGSSDVVPPAPAVSAVLSGVKYADQVRLPGKGDTIITAVPIPHQDGAVMLLAPATPVQQSLTQAHRYLWLAGVGTLLLGTGLALMVAKSLVRPVIAIEKATEQIAAGDFSTRIEEESFDEIGRLAGAVNRMTMQLESYDKRRREFLANVAHELRTPLAYVRGYAQAVLEDLSGDEENRNNYLRIVQEEAVRLGRLVDDLMDIAQMEEGQLSLDLQPIDLRTPIGQAVATIAPLAESKGVRIALKIPKGLPQPTADGARIQQVVVNLLDNGLRHTPSGGKMTVSAAGDEAGVVVKISDTGSGIEPEQLPLIFERFQKHHSHGRGLGLAIVRSIVRAHGGEVGVESKLGSGSTFWFRLPIGT